MIVVFLNFYFRTFCMNSSVCISTFEVASSRNRIEVFRIKALAKHSNCFCPTENTYEVLETSVYSCLGRSLTYSQSPASYNAIQRSYYFYFWKGSRFCLIVPLNKNGV
jgi:hypothetical protein